MVLGAFIQPGIGSCINPPVIHWGPGFMEAFTGSQIAFKTVEDPSSTNLLSRRRDWTWRFRHINNWCKGPVSCSQVMPKLVPIRRAQSKKTFIGRSKPFCGRHNLRTVAALHARARRAVRYESYESLLLPGQTVFQRKPPSADS